MKRVIGVDEIDAIAAGGEFHIDGNMIVTPGARERASARGVRLVYGGGLRASTAPAYRPRVEPTALGSGGGDVAQAVRDVLEAQEVRSASVRAVITATGINHPGIVARISTVVSEFGGDILEISQTIVQDLFTMIVIVDLTAEYKRGTSFKGFKERVMTEAGKLGIHIAVIHEDMLKAMHRV